MNQMIKNLSLPKEPRDFGFYVDGKYVPIGDREVFERLSPGHDVPVTRIPKCTQSDLDLAVDAARKAFDDRRWSGLNGQARAAVLLKAGALIRERTDEIGWVRDPLTMIWRLGPNKMQELLDGSTIGKEHLADI